MSSERGSFLERASTSLYGAMMSSRLESKDEEDFASAEEEEEEEEASRGLRSRKGAPKARMVAEMVRKPMMPSRSVMSLRDRGRRPQSVAALWRRRPRAKTSHSTLYQMLNGKRDTWLGRCFNRGLLFLIAANTVADVLITVQDYEKRYGPQFAVFESVSSVLFITEYCARLYVAGERPRYAGLRGRIAFALSAEALIDLLAFAPWLVELAAALAAASSGRPKPVELPATAFVRVLRVLRILKTERYVGSVDAIARVVSMNASIIGVGLMMALILLLFTSTALYYANRNSDDPDFASIPATMYLAILMLTGQGDPDGDLNLATQLLCAVTAAFSVTMVAIPASMLTFGFEIEATRLAKHRRERRLRRRLRNELQDLAIASSSDSSDAENDEKRARRDRRRARRNAQAAPQFTRLCPRCACCWTDDAPDARDPQAALLPVDLDSTEEEYEELVLGKTADEAYNQVKDEILGTANAAHNPVPARQSVPVLPNLPNLREDSV